MPASFLPSGIRACAPAFGRPPVPVAALLATLLLASPAHAGSTGQSVSVSAGIVDGCEVSGQAGSTLTGATLDFGSRDQRAFGNPEAATPSSGAGALEVRCNNSATSVTLTFDMGQNASSGTRRLAAGSTYVDYELFEDAAFSQPIGTSAITLGGFTANQTRALRIFGRVPHPAQAIAQGNAAATLYTDRIGLTVTF